MQYTITTRSLFFITPKQNETLKAIYRLNPKMSKITLIRVLRTWYQELPIGNCIEIVKQICKNRKSAISATRRWPSGPTAS